MLDKQLIDELNDGAKLYLCPVGVVPGGMYGIAALGSGMRFAALRIMARHDGKRFFDQTFSVAEFNEFTKLLGDDARDDLNKQLDNLRSVRMPLEMKGGRQLVYTKPHVMGIVNVTPDSFSDGGEFELAEHAIRHGCKLYAEGATIVDVGGESTRPGAKPVWEGEEKERVLPVIKALAEEGIPVSVDTRHASVMEAALEAGASMINDVSALTYDPLSLEVAAASDVPIVLMHARGVPASMQDKPVYDDTVLEIYDYLKQRIEACEAAGITKERLIVDPGLGFGKRVVEDNLAIIRYLPLFHTLGCPILIGASRKRFIGAITGVEEPKERLAGSIAAAIEMAAAGAQIIRVHDVIETVEALKFKQACHDSSVMDFPQISL